MVHDVLREAAAAAGASGGAVVDGESLEAGESWGWDPAGLRPLLEPGGTLAEPLRRRQEWLDRVLVLPAAPAPGRTHLLLAPIQLQAAYVGALVLRFEGAPPGPHAAPAARAFADLLALRLELSRAAREARAAAEERERFIRALSHEVRTPATTLSLNAYLLRSGLGPEISPGLDQSIQKVEDAVGTILRVLDGLLVLGAGGGAGEEEPELVHPREVVLSALRSVEPAADRKRLRLSLRAPRDLPVLQTDAQRLSRVLLQLLQNAVKYTAEGSVDVRLERGVRVLGPRTRLPVLWIHVADTGCGIPPEELGRILEPFAQVEEGARTDSPRRGFGLGLSIAHRLARALGGELTIESEPGRGTTVSLMLPCR